MSEHRNTDWNDATGDSMRGGKVLQVERRDFTELVLNSRPAAQSMRGFDPIYTDIVDYIGRPRCFCGSVGSCGDREKMRGALHRR